MSTVDDFVIKKDYEIVFFLSFIGIFKLTYKTIIKKIVCIQTANRRI